MADVITPKLDVNDHGDLGEADINIAHPSSPQRNRAVPNLPADEIAEGRFFCRYFCAPNSPMFSVCAAKVAYGSCGNRASETASGGSAVRFLSGALTHGPIQDSV
jgi:hypothetical protein